MAAITRGVVALPADVARQTRPHSAPRQSSLASVLRSASCTWHTWRPTGPTTVVCSDCGTTKVRTR